MNKYLKYIKQYKLRQYELLIFSLKLVHINSIEIYKTNGFVNQIVWSCKGYAFACVYVYVFVYGEINKYIER